MKVIVQPVFVLDDGESITELEHQATVIPAADWPTYSSERFPREVKDWQARLDQEHESKKPPNRAARRTKSKAQSAAPNEPVKAGWHP